eukprot:Ihof_evm15s174 gene=Ihof_evmTU15s174
MPSKVDKKNKDGTEKEKDTRDQLTRLKQKLFDAGSNLHSHVSMSMHFPIGSSSSSLSLSALMGGGGPLPEGLSVSAMATIISANQSMTVRLRVLKDLCERVKTMKMEQSEVELLWNACADLGQYHQPNEARQLVLLFMSALIKNQYPRLGLMRAHFFSLLQSHYIPADFAYRLDAVRKLTKNGRDLTYFDAQFGKFILHWLEGQ